MFLISLIGNILHKLEKIRVLLISFYLNQKYRNQMKHFGEGTRIHGSCVITGLDKIEVGKNVHIGNNAFIRGEGGLVIGENVHVSRNLVIYTHNHNYEGRALPYDNTFRLRKVLIERNVWIGMNVTILPGSHIGEGAIIGAGSVVSGTIEPLDIVGAEPPRVLKRRDEEHYSKLDREGLYGGPNGVPIAGNKPPVISEQ